MTPQWLERTAPSLGRSDAPVYLGSRRAAAHPHRVPRPSRRAGLGAPPPDCRRSRTCSPAAGGWSSSRTSSTTPTSARSSGPRRRSAWTASCCRRRRPTRCTAARCGCRWVRCSGCRTPERRAGRTRSTTLRAAGFRVLALTPAPDAVALDAVASTAARAGRRRPRHRGRRAVARAAAALADDGCGSRCRRHRLAQRGAAAAAIAFWELGRDAQLVVAAPGGRRVVARARGRTAL